MNKKQHVKPHCIAFFLLLFSLAGASYGATLDAQTNNYTPTVSDPDPLEKVNRVMYNFNDVLDRFVLKPVATLYNKIMPKPLNKGVHNVFSNLGELPTIANDLLQLHLTQMANDSWRFVINSTVGIGGLFDVATRINLPYYSNDFGLTLARWGYKDSTYMVLPFFGPNTFRDALAIPVDYYAFTVYPYIEPAATRYAVLGVGVIDRRAQLLQYQSVFDEAALDKYVFMRTAYLQRRQYQMQENAKGGNWNQGHADSTLPATSQENYDGAADQ